jgi:cytochrome b6-f complex iron-sulfur subunit
MSTPTVTKGQAVSVQTEAAKKAAAAPPVPQEGVIKPINRREFLYYIWGASMAMLLATSTGAIIWFALPRFRAGEFGGVFNLDIAQLPAKGSPPEALAAGRFWMSNTDEGFVAISAVCTHLGCLFKWVDASGRFECPCHGSKFTAAGTYIEGPAPRSLDRFTVTVVTAAGETPVAGDELADVTGATSIKVDTGKKVKGKGNA